MKRKMLLTLLMTFLGAGLAQADEGMWTFNGFPTKTVEEKYHFKAIEPWLEHVRLSSARLAGGCSGSFVSSNGLVMTNHHCAHSCIEQLSKSGKDYVASGFLAKSQTEEVRCPEIEVNRLVEITDVTEALQKATGSLQGQAFNDAQKAMMSKLEKDCSGGSDHVRCDVVTLYHGGQYNLYKYERYQDVRLVFAPEFAIAFFGGDPDNFMFPRYDFDLSFLRVYENNKPIENKEYFRWSTDSAKEETMTFVTGHPGKTSRLLTIAELEFQRDHQLIRSLMLLSEMRGFLTEFGQRGEEQHRISEARLFGVENSLKALKGRHEALLDKAFFAKKVAAETELRKKINARSAWKKEYGQAWDEIARAEQEYLKIYLPLMNVESTVFGSKLYGIAKTLVRAGTELPKENGQRFREFSDANLPHMRQDLLSSAPIYDELEIAMLTFSLTKFREELTADDPIVKRIMGQKSPAEIAESLVKGSHLKDLKVRQALLDGGAAAIQASKDPMIQFALAVDTDARTLRKKFEDEIEPVFKKNSEKVAKAQFAVNGSKTYPDATFTLRVSYGEIKGYSENGHDVRPLTTLGGAFDRHTGRAPFALPESWIKAKSKLDLETPFNFCSNNDIIGGNSGSPVINKGAEVVGLIFDGNIQSLGGEYGFDESTNRAVAVHSSSILEVLNKVYGAQRIVDDIKGLNRVNP